MPTGALCAIAYAALSAIGGLTGYAQARSHVSLVTGLVSAVLLLTGAWLWQAGSAGGAGMAMGVTVALVFIFVRRWIQTRKAMPAAIMIVAGVLAFMGMGLSLFGVI
ncbi:MULTISPECIES: TMEM14 family protein [Cyanophyceae]|uniref:TMEM14 family protein n=1 Tax=Leptolyngbya subtilissima DQ-A4 TaxID=2933933 RepID=A0ABV0K4J7_9CYAN|nr:TMEM14 family protein [Nodosilinea sp. FACHB-141]MBD2112654.1 TMEM14 family protein [Nodosilinea sp. FACHB-141]